MKVTLPWPSIFDGDFCFKSSMCTCARPCVVRQKARRCAVQVLETNKYGSEERVRKADTSSQTPTCQKASANFTIQNKQKRIWLRLGLILKSWGRQGWKVLEVKSKCKGCSPIFRSYHFVSCFSLMRTFSMLAIGFKLIANVPFGMKVMSCEPSFGESFYSNAAIDEM